MHGKFQKYMMLWCFAVLGFGAVLTLGALPSTDMPVRVLLGVLGGGLSVEMTQPLQFAFAVMGPVTMGWAVTMIGITKVARTLTGPALQTLWHYALCGVLVWLIVDSILSILTGYALNVIPNFILGGLFLAIVIPSGALKGTPIEG